MFRILLVSRLIIPAVMSKTLEILWGDVRRARHILDVVCSQINGENGMTDLPLQTGDYPYRVALQYRVGLQLRETAVTSYLIALANFKAAVMIGRDEGEEPPNMP